MRHGADARAGRRCWATTAADAATGSTRSPPASWPTPPQFWRVCDANDAVVPDALAARALVGVPIDAPAGARWPADYHSCWAASRRTQTLTQLITSVEVEESMDMPAAIQITRADLAQQRRRPDLHLRPALRAAGDGRDRRHGRRQRRQGVATGAVGAAASAVGGGAAPPAAQCIFDGYVLSQKIHLETGATNATHDRLGPGRLLADEPDRDGEGVGRRHRRRGRRLDLRRLRHHPGRPTTRDDNSPSHTEDTHSLMQRGSDIAFLRMLARRSGKFCRVACADKPGQRTGYFAVAQPERRRRRQPRAQRRHQLDGQLARPGMGRHAPDRGHGALSALFSDTDPNGAVGDTSSSGLTALVDRSRSPTFAGTADDRAAGDRGRQRRRADAAGAGRCCARPAGSSRCEAEADAERLGVVLRAGMLVNLAGIGALHSGTWIVWTVRHQLTPGGAQDAIHPAAQRRRRAADRRDERPLGPGRRRMTDTAHRITTAPTTITR